MADIFDLISKKSRKKQQLREYESRLKKLRKLYSNIDDVFDNISGVTNKSFDSINYKIGVGINGIDLSSNVIKSSFYEKMFSQDKYLRNVDDELQSEIRRCVREIQELEDDIDRLEMKIDRAREEEDE